MNPTHWVIVPIETQGRPPVQVNDPQRYWPEAKKKFEALGAGTVKEMWFVKYHNGSMILPNNSLFTGTGLLYYAAIEKKEGDVQGTASDSGAESA